MPSREPAVFHQRGLHVQHAHRRRALAADGEHLNGAMIALMPSQEDAARLALRGGERAADLHVTLVFLADDGATWTDEQRHELVHGVEEAVATFGTPVVTGNIFGAAHWNGGSDSPSWVWNVGDAERGSCLLDQAWRAALDGLLVTDHPEIPVQHSPWVPHICAAYTDDLTLLKTMEQRLGPVTFDRIRVTFGQDYADIPLLEPDAVTAAAGGLLRRAPSAIEVAAGTDFAAHQASWERSVDGALLVLDTEIQAWKRQLGEQIRAAVATDDLDKIQSLALDTASVARLLHARMMELAQEAGEQQQREARKQGVEVPPWTLTAGGSLTAALSVRDRLRQVADLATDVMSSSFIQSAKRRFQSLFGTEPNAEELANDVTSHLGNLADTGAKEAVSGAMSASQNAGRQAVLEVAPEAVYYASEILDKRTCQPCKSEDGTEYGSLQQAIKAYPVMGYKDCKGGTRCRGMIVARWEDPDSRTAAGAYHPQQASQDTEAAADGQVSALEATEPETAVTVTEELGGKPNKGTPSDKRLRENLELDEDCPDGDCEESMEAQTETAAVEEAAPVMSDAAETAPWKGPLTVEGIETGDGREFRPESLTWADLPLPLRWNKEDSHGGAPQTVAVNVGRIDRIYRDGSLIMGEGVLDLSTEDGRTVHGKIKGQFLRGVSVDVDSIKDSDVELVWPDMPESDGEGPDMFDLLFASPEKTVFHSGRIRAATLVDIPAFAEAYIALLDEAGAIVAGGEPIGALRASRAPRRTHLATLPIEPPADWFTNPGLSVPTGITVTEDGRVYGHAALWGTCHIGQEGVCITPPREDAHPYFMTGEVLCSGGESRAVGQITLGTGHAPLSYGQRAATEHYDDTGAAVADVSVGNDEHGIWVAGSIRPGTPAERIHALRASGQVSGDWRRVGGSLRLVGLLAVNVPGFPVPKVSTRIREGSQFALIASGVPQLKERVTDRDLEQWALRRRAEALRGRVHGGGE